MTGSMAPETDELEDYLSEDDEEFDPNVSHLHVLHVAESRRTAAL